MKKSNQISLVLNGEKEGEEGRGGDREGQKFGTKAQLKEEEERNEEGRRDAKRRNVKYCKLYRYR